MSNAPYVICDVETTGLNRERCLLLEVACVAVDERLNEVGSINYVIDPRSIEPLTEFNIEAEAMNLHTHNGLLDEIAQGKCVSVEVARGALIRWYAQMGINVEGKFACMMAGSNPEFDRAFFRRFFPEISHCMHYRMIDVSTLRTMVSIVTGQDSAYWKATLHPHKGKDVHRALTDCRNSLAELVAYARVMDAGKSMLSAGTS